MMRRRIACASEIVLSWKQLASPGTPCVELVDPHAITSLSYCSKSQPAQTRGVDTHWKIEVLSPVLALDLDELRLHVQVNRLGPARVSTCSSGGRTYCRKWPLTRARILRRGSQSERTSTVPTVADADGTSDNRGDTFRSELTEQRMEEEAGRSISIGVSDSKSDVLVVGCDNGDVPVVGVQMLDDADGLSESAPVTPILDAPPSRRQ